MRRNNCHNSLTKHPASGFVARLSACAGVFVHLLTGWPHSFTNSCANCYTTSKATIKLLFYLSVLLCFLSQSMLQTLLSTSPGSHHVCSISVSNLEASTPHLREERHGQIIVISGRSFSLPMHPGFLQTIVSSFIFPTLCYACFRTNGILCLCWREKPFYKKLYFHLPAGNI